MNACSRILLFAATLLFASAGILAANEKVGNSSAMDAAAPPIVIRNATILTVSRASDLVFGRPVGWLFLAVAVIGILYTVYAMYMKSSALQSFIGSAIIIIGFAGIAAVGNFPDMVPARGTPPATSLTVERAASGHLTLLVMLILAVVFVPIVLVYTALIYKTFWGKTKAADADY